LPRSRATATAPARRQTSAAQDIKPRRLRPGLSDLIGELSTCSDQFRVRWAAHNVRTHTTGVKLIHHPVVGDLELPFESFPIPADTSQSLLTYTTEPGSPSRDAPSLLASWATSPAYDSNASTHDNDQEAPQRDPGYGSRS
jgi:MmyB-like transcription regulator ligand binding domain